MTQTTDTAAVLRGNEILTEADTAPLEALKAALTDVSAEMREANNTAPAGVSGATSLEERRKLEEQDRERLARLEITTALWRRLNDAVRAAEARDAIANADDHRASLDAALDALEEAQRVAAQAKAKAMDSLDTLKKAKQAAGTRGRGLVGADPEQLDRALSLQAVRPVDIAPEGHVKHTAANGLRRVAQREVSQAKAS